MDEREELRQRFFGELDRLLLEAENDPEGAEAGEYDAWTRDVNTAVRMFYADHQEELFADGQVELGERILSLWREQSRRARIGS